MKGEPRGVLFITRKAAIFLLLTFGVSWTALILPWLNGLRDLTAGRHP